MRYLKKNTVLKTIGWINLIVFLYFACCLGADSWIPFVACCITGTYLALFAYANDFFERWLN
ncbi:hypothetical protein KPGFFKBI_01186 [[Clostridium] scindens]|nr:hypothetical protein NOBGBDLN_03830 [[Clostridium] scindens]WPB47265.1 hypothetical protein KPGFFKBI_01186 [[Clostridium] scindens]